MPPTNKESAIEKQLGDDSPLKKLIKIFRTNTVVKHHFQGNGSKKPVGVASMFFKDTLAWNSNVVPGYTAYERFSRYSDYCLTGDTKIASTNESGWIYLKDIVENFNSGKIFHVFAIDPKTNKVVVSPVSAARKTKDAEIWEVLLDNGEIIRGTNDHRIMMRDGSYKQIDQLVESDALMPFVRREYDQRGDGKTRGYYRKIKNVDGTSRSEHVLAAENYFNTKISGNYHQLVVHHKNFKRNDNGIENLEIMTSENHNKLHCDLNNRRFSIPENREKQSSIAKSRWSSDGDLRLNLSIMLRKRKKTQGWKDSCQRLVDMNKSDNHPAKKFDIQKMYNSYRKEDSMVGLASKINLSPQTITRNLKKNGYSSWKEFKEKYTNHKVVSVTKTNIIEAVYDITVDNHHNFAIHNACFVHNCEMIAYPVLGKALQIYADESTQKDEDGNIVKATSESKIVEDLLQDLFDNTLQLNGKRIYKIARDLCKYGDRVDLIDITTDNGVVNLIQMPVNEVEREEGFDKNEPQAVRYKWNTRNSNQEIPNAFVCHFRLDGDDLFHPWGQSILEAARRPWRQLILLEDAMMVYRITRSAERRAYYFDVQGIAPDNVEEAMNNVNIQLKKKKVVNEEGKIDLRYGATLDMSEDYIIPVRGNDSGTRIETLPGGQNIGDIEDIEFIQKNLFAALGIPKAFLTYDEGIGAKQVLTMEDVRFARTIAKVQEAIIAELVKVAMIHLYIKGIRGKDLISFKIKMTNPSTVAEMQKNELWRGRMDLVQAAGQGVFDTTFIYKHFLKLSDDAIDTIRKGQIQDKIFQAKLLALENSGGGLAGGAMGGMGGGMPGMGGGMPGMDAMGGMPGMPPLGGAPGGAPPNVSGMPTMPEGFNPEVASNGITGGGKDLTRRSANERVLTARGGDESNINTFEDIGSDIQSDLGLDTMKRNVTSPMGTNEALDYFLKSVYGTSRKLNEDQNYTVGGPHNIDHKRMLNYLQENFGDKEKTIIQEEVQSSFDEEFSKYEGKIKTVL